MSKAESSASGIPSTPYSEYLKRERRSRLAVRGYQIALLALCLVLWEVLPRAQLINPLFTSYPSALVPTFIELLKET
ncbi:MAG TPA: hypothetical protein VGQ19_05525, partial [Burkholderiales bacterium]|nr:hypothetical protein [Burkholderiales bacterium]